MPSPRADFECKKCEATIESLPVDSVLCPRCGARRGFRRLYNKVQVSTRGHRAAKFIDRQMRPAMDQHTSRKASAKKFEDAVTEVKDRMWEKGTPEQREQLAAAGQQPGPSGMKTHVNIPAAQAFGAIDPIARHDSAVYNVPALKRRVLPEWQR